MRRVATTAVDPLADLWHTVDRLIDRAPTEADIASHRLELLAARRWRATGRAVPEGFVQQERLAAVSLITAPLLLERAREACSQPMIVLKGPEVASRYPDPALRGFHDVDLLVPDAKAAQAELLRAGFVEVGEPELFVDIHHLRPVIAEGLPLIIEIHSRPKWLEPLTPPPFAELFEAAEASSTGVDGVFALPPEHHAVLLAVHSWAHEPLRRLRDVVDISVMTAASSRGEMSRLAGAWGVRRLWETTVAVADGVVSGAPLPWEARVWARNLAHVRERTVLENHLQRLLSDFSALPPATALRSVPRRIASEVKRNPDELWREKLGRSARAFRNALERRSHHDRELEQRGGPSD
jgi:hypothetical protein